MNVTLCGAIPFVAINYSSYEFLKETFIDPESNDSQVFYRLGCGGISGVLANVATYPFEIVRRRMMMSGLKKYDRNYKGLKDAVYTIFKKEGIKGFYRGLPTGCLEVFPLMAIEMTAYDYLKKWFY